MAGRSSTTFTTIARRLDGLLCNRIVFNTGRNGNDEGCSRSTTSLLVGRNIFIATPTATTTTTGKDLHLLNGSRAFHGGSRGGTVDIFTGLETIVA